MMVRCPQCGVRLRDEAPHCAEHGPAPPVSGAAPAEAADEAVHRAFVASGVELGPLLGRGGFGVVYAARVRDEEQPAVIKIALSERRDAGDRLRAEAGALRALGKPHAPRVFSCAVARDLTYLAMERIQAPSLDALLVAEGGPFPVTALTAHALALFDAVAAVHALGIAHLDLKPENLFIDGPLVRVIDFGLSLREGARSDDGEALGSAEYMAPEQCVPGSKLDRRADIYSLGVLLYELATGAPPFFGVAADVREAHKSARPRPLAAKLGLPRALDDVIRRCLAKDPRRRFEDVAALRAAFRQALESDRASIPAAPSDVRDRPPAASSAEKRSVALTFFQSTSGLGAVRAEVSQGRGEIVHQQGGDYVVAFSHHAGDNPVHTAVLAAQRLLASRVTTRALVDLANVSVQIRADGSRRIFSAVFGKRDRYPTPAAPNSILLTRAAAEVVSELPLVAVAGQPDRFALEKASSTHEMTALGIELSPLIGREALLDDLAGRAAAAVRERRALLFTVLGEAGLGKSRVARALAQRFVPHVSPVDILHFTARDTAYSESKLLAEVLRRTLDLPTGPAALGEERARSLLRERIGPKLDEQTLNAGLFALGLIDAQHPELRRIAAAPGALRIAAARALAEVIAARARARPLALVLDDAHLADDTTLDALELASMEGEARPLAIFVFARPPLLRARPSWAKRAAAAGTITLPALVPTAAEALARELLKPVEYIPPQALERLCARTEGVPALLVELVRGLKREGLVRRSERGTGYYLATDALEKLPDLPIVAWNASREFEALPSQLAEHARLASVLGANFFDHELDTLLALLERADPSGPVQLDARVGLDRLVEAGVLVRRRARGYDFRNALLRETIYQRIPEARRRELHLLALRVYHASASPHDRKLPRIALHAARSGERSTAASAYLELAHRAQAAHAYLEAEAHYSSALEQLGEAERAPVITAARGRGLMRFRLGRHEDAVLDLRRARSLAEAELALQLLLDEATVLDWMRDFATSTALTEQAFAYDGACSELTSARIAMSRARVHHRRGEAAATVRVGAEAAARALALGDDGYETRIGTLLMVAADSVLIGLLDDAETYFEHAIREATEHGDLHHLAAAHVNRALLWITRKDPERLLADLARGAQIGRELGAALIEYPARINMGEVAYALEELANATEHTERAIELARELWGDDNRELCACELLLARIALHRGELEAAGEIARRIAARMERARAQGSSECEFLPPEKILFELVELATRDGSEHAWDELEARAGSIDMQPQDQLSLIEARALAALRVGRVEASRRVFERALALSETLPNILSERVLRRYRALFPSSGEQVAEHAEE